MVNIVGFNLKKISIERKEEVKGKLEIKSNIDIFEIKKEKIDLVKEREVLSFNFSFNINYEPKVAEINFQGNVLVLAEPKEVKDILKKWKKKQVPNDLRLIVFNTILIKCNIKALELEDDLNLPSHLPLPKLVPEQAKQSYTG